MEINFKILFFIVFFCFSSESRLKQWDYSTDYNVPWENKKSGEFESENLFLENKMRKEFDSIREAKPFKKSDYSDSGYNSDSFLVKDFGGDGRKFDYRENLHNDSRQNRFNKFPKEQNVKKYESSDRRTQTANFINSNNGYDEFKSQTMRKNNSYSRNKGDSQKNEMFQNFKRKPNEYEEYSPGNFQSQNNFQKSEVEKNRRRPFNSDSIHFQRDEKGRKNENGKEFKDFREKNFERDGGRRRTAKKFEKLQEYKEQEEPEIDWNQTPKGQPAANPSQNVPCGLDVPRRIIGGTNTDIDEFPWLCILQYWDGTKVSHDCGGVLISKRFVLTAAHCTNGSSLTSRNIQLRKVRIGEWDLSTDKDCQGEVCSAPVQEVDIEEIIPHEGYKPKEKSQVHDIALIRLKTEALLNLLRVYPYITAPAYHGLLKSLIPEYVQPICLPFNKIGNEDYEGKRLTVSGWGRTSNARNSASNVKKKVDLPVLSWEKCRQFYDSYFGGLKIFKSQFCAGGESGQDSCQGDSGGPLMTTEKKNSEVRWYVIGIVSSGPAACGVQDRPSLYTNVSQYMDWILEKTSI